MGRCFAVAAIFLLLGAFATGSDTPSLPWLIAANIRSLAGAPPRPPDFYADPVRVGDTPRFTAITAGADHTCALTVDGDTWCWGSHQYEQLGSADVTGTCGKGTFACSATPVRLEQAPRFTALAASSRGTCGLDASGGAHYWGFGLGGPREHTLPASSGVPIEVPGNHTFLALASSPASNRTCGLAADGQAWCWEPNSGSAGLEPSRVFAGPDPVAANVRLVSIGVGTQHGCGIDDGGRVLCWGSNQLGQLGVGSSALDGGIRESVAPVAVQGGLELEHVVAGPGYSCGLDAAGAVYCWGEGFPTDTNASTRRSDRRSIPHGSLPVLLETTRPKWVELGAGLYRICGLSVDGGLYCVEAYPTMRDKRARRIDSDQPFAAFAVGANHTCAIGADGAAYCWGLSHAGQVGRPPER